MAFISLSRRDVRISLHGARDPVFNIRPLLFPSAAMHIPSTAGPPFAHAIARAVCGAQNIEEKHKTQRVRPRVLVFANRIKTVRFLTREIAKAKFKVGASAVRESLLACG